jgi:hypothetical protein
VKIAIKRKSHEVDSMLREEQIKRRAQNGGSVLCEEQIKR